ncbi:MAG TPA: DedA family protein [Candidatus Xenobia bacterium]|nr:DedA family protein [Candidatus Xenobia bacterium]
MLSWANTRWGPAALSALAFTESVIFPVPPDPLLMALSLGRPQHSYRYALISTVSSVAGGVCGYAVGYWVWHLVSAWFFAYVPGFTPENFAYVQARYDENAFLAIFAAAFTPIPYKVFTIASGVFQTGIPVLVAASVLGRGLRFFAVAGLMKRWGPQAREFIDRYFNWLTLLFFLLLALGFWLLPKLF